MFEKGIYKENTKQEIKEKVKKLGFDPITINNLPGDKYFKHKHPETKLLVCLIGSINVEVGDEKFEMEPGDRLIIPGNTYHSAFVGIKGCAFFWSEKLT